MSHFSRIKVQYKNQAAVVAALEQLGFKPVVYEQPVHLCGYRGDERPEVAHIVVPRNQISSASNDLGFIWSEQSLAYEMIISDYDRGYGQGRANAGLGAKFLQAFSMAYAVAQISSSSGFRVAAQPTTQNDGSIKLVVQIANAGAQSSQTASPTAPDPTQWVV